METLLESYPASRSTSAKFAAYDWGLSRSLANVAVYTFILLMGIFQLTHYPHTADFMNDVTYPDLARAILEKGSYQLKLLPETTFPPGFPIILAAVGMFFGLTPPALFPVVAISSSLSFIAAYEFLRRVEGLGLAIPTALLLASSPVIFSFNTVVLYPETSYFLISMLALLIALKIDRTAPGRFLPAWESILGLTLAFAVLLRSVGVALLAGLFTWITVSLLTAPEKGRDRLKRFLLPLLLGGAAQLAWTSWSHAHETLEWQLPGYPQSYISQLKVKDGNYPELGYAHFSDIPGRVGHNILLRAAGFTQLLTRRNTARFWSSPAIFGLILLTAVGLLSSLRSGGQLYDWYFLWHEIIFMFWPWNYSDRFLFPILPLACLYLWRGAKAIRNYSRRRLKRAGLLLGITGTLLCLSSAASVLSVIPFPINPEHARGDHLQTIAATLFWGLVAAIGFAMLKWQALSHLLEGASTSAGFTRTVQLRTPIVLGVIAIVAVAAIVVSGTAQSIAWGCHYQHPDITQESGYPMIKASIWIRTHEPADSVIMARDSEFIFHFTYHRIVWLPPISDPKVLMEGIRRHHVNVILVVHHDNSYWLPAEDACFQKLQQTYPGTFRLVHQDVDAWVYEVVPQQAAS